MTKEDKKKYKEHLKSTKEIAKKIEGLIALYLGKIDKRQGITRNPEITVNRRLGAAYSYVRSRSGNQTSTEKQLVNQFKATYAEALKKVNTFFDTDWKTYKASLEKIEISPFKEIKKF